VYESRKAEIDTHLATAKKVAEEQYGKVSAQASELYSRITPRKAGPPKQE
jgi:hypothetical protein